MKNKFYFRIYGLNVQSDIELPGAMPCSPVASPDVVLSLGAIPEFIRGSQKKGYGTWTNGFTSAWFFTPNAAEFYVEQGNKVTISPIENPNWDLISSLFLSAGMCLILLQRNEPVFHGSALEYKGKAFIVSGDSGAGKSSVSFELMKKPYGFLADDTVRVHNVNGTFMVEPSYPQQKVCRDMALRMGLQLEKLRYIDEERDKFAKMCVDRYLTQGVPLKAMIILRKDPQAQEVYFRELSGQDYVESMTNAFYLAMTYQNIVGFPAELMMQLIAMASQIKVFSVCRPAAGNTLQAVTDLVEHLVTQAIEES